MSAPSTINTDGIRHYRETDGGVELWFPKGQELSQQEWLRVKAQRNAQTIRVAEVELLTVRVQRCVEQMRKGFGGMLKSLFGARTPETTLHIPGTNGKMSDRTAIVSEGLRPAYLIQNTAPAVTEQSIRACIANILTLEPLGDQWLLETDGLPKRALSPLHREMKEKSDEIIDALRHFGSIVYDRCPDFIEQVCVLFKNVHGSVSMIQDAARTPAYALSFVRQHNAIVAAMRHIGKMAGKNLHLFLEGMYAGEEDNIVGNYAQSVLDTNVTMEQAAQNVEKDPSAAHRMFTHMATCMEKDRSDEQVQLMAGLFDHLIGETRFLLEWVRSGVDLKGRVHGMATMRRRQGGQMLRGGAKSAEEYIAHRNTDLDLTHRHLVSDMEKASAPGTYQMVVLGGGHFRSGTPSLVEVKYGLVRSKAPFLLENYLEQSTALSGTRLIVLEPNHYMEASDDR